MKINQLKAGVVLSYISEAVKVASGLLYTPVMLRLLGQSEYGLYQLVYSVVSYLSLLSMGFGGAYIRFYSRYKADADDDGVARLNGMFMVIFCVISAVCILCGAVMLGNVRGIFGEGLTAAELDKSKVLLVLMVFNLALTFPNSVFSSYITAHERFFFQRVIGILQGIFNPFLTLPILLLGFGSIGVVCITTVLIIARFITEVWFCFSKLNIRFIFRGFRFSLLKEMWMFTFFIFLNMIIDQVNYSVDKFILGRYLGTVSVAIYGVGAQIDALYLNFSTSVSGVFAPRINKMVAEKDDGSGLMALFTKVGRIQFIILSLVLTGFIFFGGPFIRFWAGEGYKDSYAVALLLMGPAIIPLIQNIGIEIQRAKNKHQIRSVVYFFMAVGNVLMSIPLAKAYGPVGSALGTAISVMIANVLFMNWYYHNYLGLNMISFWKSISGFIPSLILPCVLGAAIMSFLSAENIIILFVEIVVYTIVYVISFYLIGMNEDEKRMVMGPVKKVINVFSRNR